MMTGPEIVQRVKEQLAQLTGHKPDTVSAFGKDDDGWHVTVEMVEMTRIPESSDLLATYETLLDDEGNLVRYRRTRRYNRGQVMEEEA